MDLDTIVGAVNATSDLIADANQNELVDFTATGSAVNHVGITNAATGNGPTIEAKGDDSNIDLNITPKGTGDSIFTNKIKVDDVIEKTTDHGVEIEGVLVKDSIVKTDDIQEKTTDHGVEIDGVLVKDGDVGVATISSKAGTSIGVTLGTDAGDDFNVGSGKLVVEGDNGRVGVGTADPDMPLHVKSADNNLLHLESTDQDALFKLADNGGHFQINTANNNTSLGTNGRAEMMRFSGTTGVVFNEDGLDQDFRIESDTLPNVFEIQGDNGTVSIANSSFNPSAESISLKAATSGGAITIQTGGLVWTFFAGSADVQTDASGFLKTVSDKNQKRDLGKIESGQGLSTITQMQAHRFNFLSDLENGIDIPTIGFFAQDLHAINPEIGIKQIKEIDGKEEELWGINSKGILAYMVEAIKELSEKVNALEKA